MADNIEQLTKEELDELSSLVTQVYDEIASWVKVIGDSVEQLNTHPAFLSMLMADEEEIEALDNSDPRVCAAKIGTHLTFIRGILLFALHTSRRNSQLELLYAKATSHALLHEMKLSTRDSCKESHNELNSIAQAFGSQGYRALAVEMWVGESVDNVEVVGTIMSQAARLYAGENDGD